MPGTAAFAVLAISLWRMVGSPAANEQLTFHDHVDVSAPRVSADILGPLTYGTVLGERDLIALGGDLSRAFDISAQASGAFVGTRRVRIDGLVSAAPADGRGASSVSLRSDPFSVEYGGLDQIELAFDLPAPARKWMFTATPSLWRRGGEDPLTGRSPALRRIGATLSGPGPLEALTFFTRAERFTQNEIRGFASSDGGAVVDDQSRVTGTGVSSAAAGMAWSAPAALLRASFMTSRTEVANAGIGGLATADAAFALDSAFTQAQLTWDVSRRLRHRGGVVFRRSRVTADAQANGPATVSAAEAVTGADLQWRATDTDGWTLRHVAHSPDQRWLLGLDVSRDAIAEVREYNPGGVRRFGSDGRSSLTTTVAAGELRLGAASAAAFAQKIVRLGPSAAVRAGVRAEWFESEGVFVSPRVSLAARAGAFLFSAAAALSAEEWTAASLAGLAWRDPEFSAQRIDGRMLRFRIDDNFARRRDRIVRIGAARQLGHVHAAVEHTWTHGSRLAGATRAADGDGLIDTLSSDRRVVRHQTHVSGRTALGPLSIVAHYEWLYSHDDTDGWMSFPATPGDAAAEWARSTGLPRHNASVVISGRLWRTLQLLVAARAASGNPYSVLSGADPAGLGTFTDRGGAGRNSHEMPGWSSVNLYLSRTFRIPRFEGAAIDAGIRVENAFSSIRVEEVGRVFSTPIFGKPLSAGSGRTIGFWAAIARR